MLPYNRVLRFSNKKIPINTLSKRHVSGLLARLTTRLFKLRYLIIGGTGGYAINKKYDEIKTYLPDFSFSKYVSSEEIAMVHNIISTINEFGESASTNFNSLLGNFVKSNPVEAPSNTVYADTQVEKGQVEKTKVANDKKKISVQELQEAMFKSEMAFHKRIESLLEENRTLRSELLLRGQRPSQKGRINKSLIDMYSEVLDELSDLDSTLNSQDQLPRVVVVGDQSAGKTSVLEMIAQARIFPRGSGEMMTRSPVKVTLSEGPYHVATFKDSPREYDLTKESELAALRKDIEMRMKALVTGGKTISSDVISINVKGPGLQRMVLVDLPGIISTVTLGMQSDTRETIKKMAKHYMSNPNAIILCVQDGSIDAERSNVTDLVSNVDPTGKRTIFVLTKVDLAEANLLNPNRIKQILNGKILPMKALGYFAVVTGKGSKDESIQSIKEYEEEFFNKSRLFREGALELSQMTTNNLSKAVSEQFWKMVKDSVEHHADTYRALRYNLETEWKNSYWRYREMDRDELFEKARNEILDDLISLNGIRDSDWEKQLRLELWSQLKDYVYDNIFQPAQYFDNNSVFQTKIDIWLRDWVNGSLPKSTIKAGWETLYNQLDRKLTAMEKDLGRDNLFDSLKASVHKEARSHHQWDSKAEAQLRVIQANVLSDQTIHRKSEWTSAVEFLEQATKDRLKTVNQSIADMCGPNWFDRWTRWKSRSTKEKMRLEIINEVENLFVTINKPLMEIASEDLTTIRRNLQARKLEVTDDMIVELWKPLVQRLNLERSLYTCNECANSFYYYQQGFLNASNSVLVKEMEKMNLKSAKTNGEFSDCRDVLFFARLMRMLEATSNALRQQIVNGEARRLEYHVKQVLNNIANDPVKLRDTLTGPRVQIAEDLKRIRYIQEKLEEFIAALKKVEQ